MAIHYIRPDIRGELRDPFDCDEQIVKALVTVGAFVALADGPRQQVGKAPFEAPAQRTIHSSNASDAVRNRRGVAV